MDVGHLVANVRRLGRTFTLSFSMLNAPRHTSWSSLFSLNRVAMEVFSWVCIFAEVFYSFLCSNFVGAMFGDEQCLQHLLQVRRAKMVVRYVLSVASSVRCWKDVFLLEVTFLGVRG